MKNLFEVNFHLGKESERFLRDFDARRADYAVRSLEHLPADDLKALRESIRTFDAPDRIAV